ncbi:MAG: DUF29 domain-containing protein, partial [Candidatus Binataceae bacterium]
MGKAAQNEHDQNSLYKRDPYTWALEQARALRERRSAALDWDNVAEEIEDVGQRQRDKLTSYLARILQHLWKLSHWSSMRTRNQRIWRVEIDAYRDSAHQQLRRNPGLKGSI